MLAARHPVTILLLALVACGPPKSDAETGDTTSTGTTQATGTGGHSSTPTTGDGGGDDGVPTSTTTATGSTSSPPDPSTTTQSSTTTTTTATTTTTTTGLDENFIPIFPEETENAFIHPAPDVPPGDCDPWKADCPEGQKCSPSADPGDPTWTTLRCVPLVVDPAPPGAPCVVIGHATSGLDSCERHALCWDFDETLHGTCISLCSGDEHDNHCPNSADTCVLANDKILPVCLPSCDPLVLDCLEGHVCVPTDGDFACAPDASGAGGGLFASCNAGNACDPGLVCASSSLAAQCDPRSDECCLPFCDRDAANSCPPTQTCQVWLPNSVGLEHDNVGVCVDP